MLIVGLANSKSNGSVYLTGVNIQLDEYMDFGVVDNEVHLFCPHEGGHIIAFPFCDHLQAKKGFRKIALGFESHERVVDLISFQEEPYDEGESMETVGQISVKE